MNKEDLICLFTQNTDNYYVLNYLLNREWVNVIEIIRGHGRGNEVNFAARSRISDINKKIKPYGFGIISRIGENKQGEYLLTVIDKVKNEEEKIEKSEMPVLPKSTDTELQQNLF